MDKLVWAAGAAAVVYVLWVRPLQQRVAAESSGSVTREREGVAGMTAAELAGAAVGQAGLTVAGEKSPAPAGGCGCGGVG